MWRAVRALPYLDPRRAKPSDVRAFQGRQLRRLVRHAYQHVPHYRALFDRAGVRPEQIQILDDLRQLPIVNRQYLQGRSPGDLIARGVKPDRLIVRRTSGSTGEPLRIVRTWSEEQLLGFFRLRASLDFGLRVHDRLALVVRVRPRHPRDRRPFSWGLQVTGLCRKLEIECTQSPEVIARTLHAYRPDVLGGFTGVLAQVAQVFAREDTLRCRPRYILTGAEASTPAVRSGIAEGLHAPVFDTYASHEFRLIAWQCKHTGEYHTCDDSVILEVLVDGRPAEPGERGTVVVTALHSWAMPFLRYALDDVVTQGSERCACGSAFGTIQSIDGRIVDNFALPGGELVHPYRLVPPLLDVAAGWIRQYQMVQEDRDSLTLRLVPTGTIAAGELERVRIALQPMLGRAELRIRLVGEIRPEPTGKFRLFVPYANPAEEVAA